MRLVPATADSLRAECHDPESLPRMIEAVVPATWPPPTYERKVSAYALARLEKNPEHSGWWVWYLIRIDCDRDTLVGTIGFKGAPSLEGTVEIGYSILEDHQRLGLATEAVNGLLDWAFSNPDVKRVIAHTLPSHRPSIRVLQKSGFEGPIPCPEPGNIRFVKQRGF